MSKENHSSFIFHTWANFLHRPFTLLERKETRTLLINGIPGPLLTHALLGKCAGFSDAPRLSLRVLKAASWCKRLFYGTWQDPSPFSGSLLVCVARVWWGRTGPLWAFGGAGIGVRNFRIPWPLLFLMLHLCCSTGLSSSSGSATRGHRNILVLTSYMQTSRKHHHPRLLGPAPPTIPRSISHVANFPMSCWHGTRQWGGFS